MKKKKEVSYLETLFPNEKNLWSIKFTKVGQWLREPGSFWSSEDILSEPQSMINQPRKKISFSSSPASFLLILLPTDEDFGTFSPLLNLSEPISATYPGHF